MSAFGAITAYDGATTPVAHVFTNADIKTLPNDIIAMWKELSTTIPEYALVKASVRRTTLKSGTVRTALRVEVPVMESISGQNASGYTAAPKVAYVDAYEFVNYAHPRSTAGGRRLARQLTVNLAGAVSTSVAPVTSGQIPESFDYGILPA